MAYGIASKIFGLKLKTLREALLEEVSADMFAVSTKTR